MEKSTQLLETAKTNTGLTTKRVYIIIGVVFVVVAAAIAVQSQKLKDKQIMANYGHQAVTDTQSSVDIDGQLGRKVEAANNITINNNLNPAVIPQENKKITTAINPNEELGVANAEPNGQVQILPPLQPLEHVGNNGSYVVAPLGDVPSGDNSLEQAKKADIGVSLSSASTVDDGYSAENNQAGKNQFARTDSQLLSDYNKSSIKKPLSKYELKAGSIIPAILRTSINSDLPSQIITAYVRENVYDTVSGNYLLIPKGATLIGKYDSGVAYGQNRLLVAWNRLIYPNGKSYNFVNGFSGADAMGRAGFDGTVNNHYFRLFGASFMMGAITAGVTSASGANTNSGNNLSLGQSLATGVGIQAGQTGLALTQKNMNVQPTIEIDAGYKFNILIATDCILK